MLLDYGSRPHRSKKSQAQPDSALSQHKDSLKGGHKKCAPKASALQPQESLSPELLVFFDFPRIAVDILSPSLAATDDRVRNDFGLSCNDESWWRVVYQLLPQNTTTSKREARRWWMNAGALNVDRNVSFCASICSKEGLLIVSKTLAQREG